MTFAELMEQAMREQGITQAELVRRTGLSKQYLSSLAHGGHKDPTFDKAVAIIKALDMNVDEFCEKLYKGGE